MANRKKALKKGYLHFVEPVGEKPTAHKVDFGTFYRFTDGLKVVIRPWITKKNKHEGKKAQTPLF